MKKAKSTVGAKQPNAGKDGGLLQYMACATGGKPSPASVSGQKEKQARRSSSRSPQEGIAGGRASKPVENVIPRTSPEVKVKPVVKVSTKPRVKRALGEHNQVTEFKPGGEQARVSQNRNDRPSRSVTAAPARATPRGTLSTSGKVVAAPLTSGSTSHKANSASTRSRPTQLRAMPPSDDSTLQRTNQPPRPSDSGFHEQTLGKPVHVDQPSSELLIAQVDVDLDQASLESDLPPLTQQSSPQTKCTVEENIFWLASPPSDSLARKGSIKEVSGYAYSASTTPTKAVTGGDNSSGRRSWLDMVPSPSFLHTPKGFKRCYSTSDIERSPLGKSFTKRQRNDSPGHWTATDRPSSSNPRITLRDFIARCKSVLQEEKPPAKSPVVPGSAKGSGSPRPRQLQRSVSLPVIPSVIVGADKSNTPKSGEESMSCTPVTSDDSCKQASALKSHAFNSHQYLDDEKENIDPAYLRDHTVQTTSRRCRNSSLDSCGPSLAADSGAKPRGQPSSPNTAVRAKRFQLSPAKSNSLTSKSTNSTEELDPFDDLGFDDFDDPSFLDDALRVLEGGVIQEAPDAECDIEFLRAVDDATVNFSQRQGTTPAAVAPPTRSTTAVTKPFVKAVHAYKRYLRFRVRDLHHGYYGGLDESSGRHAEKVLRLEDSAGAVDKYLHLREDWWYTDVAVGDYIHVMGEFDPFLQRCIVDNQKNLAVLHPDTLISATYVSESFECSRKIVLQERVKAAGEYTEPLVYGSILHCLWQTALTERDFSTARLHAEIEFLVRGNVPQVYAMGKTEDHAIKILKTKVPLLQAWAAKYTDQTWKVSDQRKLPVSSGKGIRIGKVLDIEESIWSPAYGIKGMVDATVQLQLPRGTGKPRTVVAPLEFKTGRNAAVVSHRAQTTLYTLLLNDRYDVDVALGYLYYLETGELSEIPSLRDEIRLMIIKRNELAGYFVSHDKLPPMVQNAHRCKRCYVRDTCAVYHKAMENGNPETSGMGSLFEDLTGQLTVEQLQFFHHWETLITMEEKDVEKVRSEIWTLTGREREKMQRCFSNMRIVSNTNDACIGRSGLARFRYQFVASDGEPGREPSFMDLQFAVNDKIIVSTEDGHIALAMGVIVELAPDKVTVAVNRRLRGPPKRVLSQLDSDHDFEDLACSLAVSQLGDSTLYRIDKDEFSGGLGLARNNLLELFRCNGDVKRRQLIVDLEQPYFRECATVEFDGKLNADQRRAVEKVLAAKDYALILGMPGTGKTTTIAHIIKTLVTQNKTVLLTSYTHTAVDNILMKLRDLGVDFLRLGHEQRIDPEIVPFTAESRDDLVSVERLEKFYASKKVVATTCLGINHMLLAMRTFDYCIVDEASQLTLPVCVGPLRFAGSFVLVGDHYQLPPLVRNVEARDNGLSKSLFQILSDAHPEAVVSLEHQYRMNLDIMLLSNTLVYNNQLKCGSAEVARSSLNVPLLDKGVRQFHSYGAMLLDTSSRPLCTGTDNCWLRQLIEPNRKVVFVNTDSVPAAESRPGDLVQNEVEAALVHQTVEALIYAGVEETALGVISPYRSQLRILNRLLKHRSGLAIQTVDKFQGSDKDCVLVSLVRSNASGNVGALLKDWRRINVAFTRAKRKLVIFGSQSTLQGDPLFSEFLHIVEEKCWIFRLPSEAHLLHQFPSADEASVPDTRTGSPPAKVVRTGKTAMQVKALRKRGPSVVGDVLHDIGL
ncbi:Tripartite DNA replication factor [Gaertneriomyces sp. JEL0708]|nr:Tripartite DNA replication factor [Gaertneriomyces sp. JEL0708]